MAPPHKVSKDQLVFLESHMEAYLDCGKSREALTNFWITVNRDFFARFPERQHLVDTGVLPSELNPPLPNAEGEKILGKAIKSRKQYIKSWFRNAAATIRRPKPVIGTNIKQRFTRASRTRCYLQPLEVYEKLHRIKITSLTNDMLKKTPSDKTNDASSEDSSSNSDPKDSDSDNDNPHVRHKHSRSLRMEIRRKARKAAWADETEDIKREVQEEWERQKQEFQSMTGEEKSTGERCPQQLQENIEQVRAVLLEVAESVYELTGWTLVCLYGGLRPVEGGKIAVGSCAYGQDEYGNDFPMSHPGWNDMVDSFGKWLKIRYPLHIRQARALVSTSLEVQESQTENRSESIDRGTIQSPNASLPPPLPQSPINHNSDFSRPQTPVSQESAPRVDFAGAHQLSPSFVPPWTTQSEPEDYNPLTPPYWRRRDSPSIPVDIAFPQGANLQNNDIHEREKRRLEKEREDGLRFAEEECRRQQAFINTRLNIRSPLPHQSTNRPAIIDPQLLEPVRPVALALPAPTPSVHVPLSRPTANPLKEGKKSDRKTTAKPKKNNQKKKSQPSGRLENPLIANTSELRKRYLATKDLDLDNPGAGDGNGADSEPEVAGSNGDGDTGDDVKRGMVGDVGEEGPTRYGYVGWEYNRQGQRNQRVTTSSHVANKHNPAGDYQLAIFTAPQVNAPATTIPAALGRRSR